MPALCTSAFLHARGAGRAEQRNAVYRAGFEAQFAAGAVVADNSVTELRSSHDGISRANLYTARASDADILIDKGDLLSFVDSKRRIKRAIAAVKQFCQRADRGGASRRALINIGCASKNCRGVGSAPGVTALSALYLGEQCINPFDGLVGGVNPGFGSAQEKHADDQQECHDYKYRANHSGAYQPGKTHKAERHERGSDQRDSCTTKDYRYISRVSTFTQSGKQGNNQSEAKPAA